MREINKVVAVVLDTLSCKTSDIKQKTKFLQSLDNLNIKPDEVIYQSDYKNLYSHIAKSYGINDWLWFLHPDIEISKNCLKELKQSALNNPSAYILGPKIYCDNNKRLAGFGISSTRKFDIYSAPYCQYDQGQFDAESDILAVDIMGAFVECKRFLSLKGFDSKIHNPYLSLDFCLRARLFASRVIKVSTAVMIYNPGASGGGYDAVVKDPEDPRATGPFAPESYFEYKTDIFSKLYLRASYSAWPLWIFMTLFAPIYGIFLSIFSSYKKQYFISGFKLLFSFFNISQKRFHILKISKLSFSALKPLFISEQFISVFKNKDIKEENSEKYSVFKASYMFIAFILLIISFAINWRVIFEGSVLGSGAIGLGDDFLQNIKYIFGFRVYDSSGIEFLSDPWSVLWALLSIPFFYNPNLIIYIFLICAAPLSFLLSVKLLAKLKVKHNVLIAFLWLINPLFIYCLINSYMPAVASFVVIPAFFVALIYLHRKSYLRSFIAGILLAAIFACNGALFIACFVISLVFLLKNRLLKTLWAGFYIAPALCALVYLINYFKVYKYNNLSILDSSQGFGYLDINRHITYFSIGFFGILAIFAFFNAIFAKKLHILYCFGCLAILIVFGLVFYKINDLYLNYGLDFDYICVFILAYGFLLYCALGYCSAVLKFIIYFICLALCCANIYFDNNDLYINDLDQGVSAIIEAYEKENPDIKILYLSAYNEEGREILRASIEYSYLHILAGQNRFKNMSLTDASSLADIAGCYATSSICRLGEDEISFIVLDINLDATLIKTALLSLGSNNNLELAGQNKNQYIFKIIK